MNRLGETIQLTGFNHYTRSANAILAAGGTIVDAGPALLTLPGGDSAFAVAVDEAGQEISVTFDDTLDWLDENGGHMLVAMGTPQNASRNFFGGPYRIAGTIDGDSVTPPTTPSVLPVPYAVQEGQKVWCRARIIRADGRVSQFFRGTAVVSA
ncbi:hypothetical protein KAR91_35080 [Candidatus Pacearchaeota archaeon]|nr:hypothetical protein [Candidatus Pacearchaeota archaeon]